jgi:AcrR family transcriptional regulator
MLSFYPVQNGSQSAGAAGNLGKQGIEMAGNRKNTTREKIKDVAQQLIAEHGVDGISIRDIIIAAGQRNMASLYYYFRSKEELIKELVFDANAIMEATRTDYLAKIEEIGEPLTVRQIVHVILSASLAPSPRPIATCSRKRSAGRSAPPR